MSYKKFSVHCSCPHCHEPGYVETTTNELDKRMERFVTCKYCEKSFYVSFAITSSPSIKPFYT